MSTHSSFVVELDSEGTIQTQKPGKNMSEQWLRCHLLKGMFSDEVAIKLTSGGKDFSVFVPREFVRGQVDQIGEVKVMVFHQGGARWAVLPTAQRAIVQINEADLVIA